MRCSQNVVHHSSGNEGICIRPYKALPVLGIQWLKKWVYQIRWNNSDRERMKMMSPGGEDINDWYNAARHWVDILRRPSSEYLEQLRPGTPLSMQF